MKKLVIMPHLMTNLGNKKGSSLIKSGLTKKCKNCVRK
jgi:hypothetical protein